jgi:hypothetical protein
MIVTEIDEFTAEVQVIDNGDRCGNAEHLATAQALANRTRNHKTRLDTIDTRISGLEVAARITASGTSIATGSKFTLAITQQTGGFDIESDELVFPQSGLYFVTLSARVTGSATANPLIIQISVYDGSVIWQFARGVRWSATVADHFMLFGPAGQVDIPSVATQLQFLANGGGGSTTIVECLIDVMRIGPSL